MKNYLTKIQEKVSGEFQFDKDITISYEASVTLNQNIEILYIDYDFVQAYDESGDEIEGRDNSDLEILSAVEQKVKVWVEENAHNFDFSDDQEIN